MFEISHQRGFVVEFSWNKEFNGINKNAFSNAVVKADNKYFYIVCL